MISHAAGSNVAKFFFLKRRRTLIVAFFAPLPPTSLGTANFYTIKILNLQLKIKFLLERNNFEKAIADRWQAV
jgi:hypothetical protein